MNTLPLDKTAMTAAILKAKQTLGVKWEAIGHAAGLSPVFVTSACLGMNSLAKEPADKIAAALELGPEVSAALQEFPHKHWDKSIPTDPVVYRFYEMINVYGDTIKALIHEEFGDDIMSAIDFDMTIKRKPDPKGDRVHIEMSGKFLQYRSW